MKDMLRASAVHLTRRKFLYRVGAATFGVAAAGGGRPRAVGAGGGAVHGAL